MQVRYFGIYKQILYELLLPRALEQQIKGQLWKKCSNPLKKVYKRNLDEMLKTVIHGCFSKKRIELNLNRPTLKWNL
jgi:hypothetical protein